VSNRLIALGILRLLPDAYLAVFVTAGATAW
jgi:hypothetical protein